MIYFVNIVIAVIIIIETVNLLVLISFIISCLVCIYIYIYHLFISLFNTARRVLFHHSFIILYMTPHCNNLFSNKLDESSSSSSSKTRPSLSNHHHLTIGTSSLSLGLSTISALWNLSNSNDPANTMITPDQQKNNKDDMKYIVIVRALFNRESFFIKDEFLLEYGN